MVRHNHHATNPEKLIPKMLATPVRLPMAANWPMVEKENGFMNPPRTARIRRSRPRAASARAVSLRAARAGRRQSAREEPDGVRARRCHETVLLFDHWPI